MKNDILKSLYNGIIPYEEIVYNNVEYYKRNEEIDKLLDQLEYSLSNEQSVVLRQIQGLFEEQMELEASETFSYAFKLATRLIIESFGEGEVIIKL